MTILPLDECRKINEIVDYIVMHRATTVAKVKEKFGLTNEEYDMISELMMPAIRYQNKAYRLEYGIRELMHKLIDDPSKDEMVQKALKLKEKGYTVSTISKKLGISETSVKLYTMESYDENSNGHEDNRAS